MNCSTTPLHPTPNRWLRNGSLVGCEAPYRRWLDERGYANTTSRSYILCLAHFAKWATERGLTYDTLSSESIARFVDEHLPCCDCPRPVQRHRAQVRAALRQLQPALRAAGVTVAETAPTATKHELERYDAYLRDRCGLAATTRLGRRRIIHRLLELPADATGRPALQAAHRLRGFVTERAQRWSPVSRAGLMGALRSYLRYRASRGDDVAALLPAIASPARWRLANLPETLSTDGVERVLASFDPSSALVVSRLGHRTMRGPARPVIGRSGRACA